MLGFQLLDSTDHAGCLATAFRRTQRRVEPSFSFPGSGEVICHQAQAIQGRHNFRNLRTLCPIVQFERTHTNGHSQKQIATCFFIYAVKHLACFNDKCVVICPVDTWITNIFVVTGATWELKVEINTINEPKCGGFQPHFKAVNEFCAVLGCRDHLEERAAIAPTTD